LEDTTEKEEFQGHLREESEEEPQALVKRSQSTIDLEDSVLGAFLVEIKIKIELVIETHGGNLLEACLNARRAGVHLKAKEHACECPCKAPEANVDDGSSQRKGCCRSRCGYTGSSRSVRHRIDDPLQDKWTQNANALGQHKTERCFQEMAVGLPLEDEWREELANCSTAHPR